MIAKYLDLMKPRIGTMVMVSTLIGYLLASEGKIQPVVLVITLIGTFLSCAGAATLNCYLERESDARMKRTCMRPLVTGEISPANALALGILLVLSGTSLLAAQVNLLTGFLALLTAFLYVLVYTPLKRITWLNTMVGAIPGAMPPMGGWVAHTGHLDFGAWVMFSILFLWQHPHFFAIAWMYKDDYAAAGIKMLPVVDPDGRSTFRQIKIYSLLLIPVSLIPAFWGHLGSAYVIATGFAGAAMLYVGLLASESRSRDDAWKLLKTSLIFLPALLIGILIDYKLSV